MYLCSRVRPCAVCAVCLDVACGADLELHEKIAAPREFVEKHLGLTADVGRLISTVQWSVSTTMIHTQVMQWEAVISAAQCNGWMADPRGDLQGPLDVSDAVWCVSRRGRLQARRTKHTSDQKGMRDEHTVKHMECRGVVRKHGTIEMNGMNGMYE